MTVRPMSLADLLDMQRGRPQVICLQVRWYSFQFLMQQMAENFTELTDAASALLQRMPNSNLHL